MKIILRKALMTNLLFAFLLLGFSHAPLVAGKLKDELNTLVSSYKEKLKTKIETRIVPELKKAASKGEKYLELSTDTIKILESDSDLLIEILKEKGIKAKFVHRISGYSDYEWDVLILSW